MKAVIIGPLIVYLIVLLPSLRSRNDINSQFGSARKRLEQMDALRSERDALSSQLDKAKLALSAQLNSANNVVKERDATILQLLEEKSKHVEELSKAYATIADGNKSMRALRANRDIINAQLANANIALAAKDFALNELTKNQRDVELQLANAKDVFNEMQAEIDRLKKNAQEQFEARNLFTTRSNVSGKTDGEDEGSSSHKQASRPLFYSPSTSYAFNNYLLSRLKTDASDADDNFSRSETSTNQSASDLKAATKHENEGDINLESKQSAAANDNEVLGIVFDSNGTGASTNKNVTAGDKKRKISIPEFEGILYRGYHIDNTEVGESSL